MIGAELHDGVILLKSEYRQAEMIKTIPGAKWNSEQKCWWLPLSWASCVQLRATFDDELQIGPELRAWATAEKTGRVDPCTSLRSAEDAPDLATKYPQLYPFQRAGVQFLVTARQALCADEMGLGKTVQTIIALMEIGDEAYPALVVSPNSMKYVWQDEFAKWAPHRRVVVVTGGAKHRREAIAQVRNGEADVAVINWEALRLHTRLAGYGGLNLSEKEKQEKELNEIDWRSVIADEAHKAKDPTAKQTRALWWIGKDATQRYALTGTPVANSPEDVWSLLRFISPEEFPTKVRFVDRYALQSWNAFGFMQVVGLKAERKDEFFKILDPRFIRRLKKAVLPQLPEKTYNVRYIELESKQRKAYDNLRKHMIAEIDGGVVVAASPLVRMTRLVQFASACGEITEDGGIRLAAPSCKVDALEEVIAELGGKKAVVFAESRQLIELAAARLEKNKVKIGMVTGASDPYARQDAINRFQNRDTQVLLVTLGAGGEGLTLTAADTAIFLQRSFSLVKNMQAEDRIHRIGQEASAVNIVDIVALDTIEQVVHETYGHKAEMLEEVVRDEATLKEWLNR